MTGAPALAKKIETSGAWELKKNLWKCSHSPGLTVHIVSQTYRYLDIATVCPTFLTDGYIYNGYFYISRKMVAPAAAYAPIETLSVGPV